MAYLGMVTLLVMFPGPNTVLIMQSVGLSGKRTGYGNVFGIVSGLSFHAIAAVVGLSLIVTGSALIYHLIQLLGAIYIIYLGIRSFFIKPASFNENISIYGRTTSSHTLSDSLSVSLFPAFVKGFVSTLFNPKIALFFVSIFPQFIHNHKTIVSTSFVLTLLYAIVSFIWYSSLVLFIDKFRPVLSRQKIQKTIQYVTGILLIVLGLRIAIRR